MLLLLLLAEDDGADNGSDFLKASSKGAKSKPATSTNPDKPSYTDAPLPKRLGGSWMGTQELQQLNDAHALKAPAS